MNNRFIAFGVAGALIYMGVSGTLGNAKANTAVLALGTVMLAKQTPVIKDLIA